jgi:hypothetical protein
MAIFNLYTKKGVITSMAIIGFLLVYQKINAQSSIPTPPPDSIKYAGATYQKVVTNNGYPKVIGYLSFILPLETYQSGIFTQNFSNHTTSIGFPVGVNVLYSKSFGFSYEFTPTIKASGGNSKMSNLLFDPGTMFRFEHGFTIITRLAFETSGRYGFTPVFNKVYARTKAINYFVAASLPTRFGNTADPSIGLSLQFGFTFN